MPAQRGEIDVAVRDQYRHGGLAVTSGNFHAGDRRVGDAVELAQGRRHLRRRDVFPFPAEGVADAVDEIEEALFVAAHQVAGAEPRVARLEYLAEDLLLGVRGAGVALEAAADVAAAIADAPERLARFVHRARHA